MNKFECGLPHEFKEVVLKGLSGTNGGQRTFKVDMVVTDQDSVFMAHVLSTLVGHTIGYRLISSGNLARDFARILDVDLTKKKISVCPVSFEPKKGSPNVTSVLTEHRNNLTCIKMIDIADVVLLKAGDQVEVVVAD